MQIYKAPIREMMFLLEALDYQSTVAALPAFEAYELETVQAMIEQIGAFCTKEMLPLNRSGDEEGVSYDPETHDVTTAKGFKALYRKYAENGLTGLVHPERYGGSGAPHALAAPLSEMSTATNKSFSMCPGLTQGLIDTLLHHGSEEQKDYFLPKLVGGDWSGTMCLTEAQCGTDLGLITTRAEPDGDHYRLTGNKIWITFGEHDLTENIIHLVLARLPDAPPGIKGISVFLVPKILKDGSRNGAYCAGLEHKMGINASPTCVVAFENAVGYLVGEPHKGMRAMFTMMNQARLHVGLEGVALGEISYQTAVAFAKDRQQSRALDKNKRDPNAKADNILVHPDVRRMLLNVRASTEGMRGLAYWVSMLIDLSIHHPDEGQRADAGDLVALLTPVVKSYLTEKGFWNTSEAMQVTGGAGYTRDWSIEQYMRDGRIALLYEGTNHIQALDLVGRKLPLGGGRLMQKFAGEITAFIRANKGDEAMAEFIEPLKRASKRLNEMTMALGMKGMSDPEEVGAVASTYLNVFALTAIAYIWCRQAKYALGKEGRFYETKIKTARYFFKQILPETDSLIAIINEGKQHIMAFTPDEF